MPTAPVAVITVGVLSGFALSSTSSALPAPTCVIRRALELELTEITAAPEMFAVVASKLVIVPLAEVSVVMLAEVTLKLPSVKLVKFRFVTVAEVNVAVVPVSVVMLLLVAVSVVI